MSCWSLAQTWRSALPRSSNCSFMPRGNPSTACCSSVLVGVPARASPCWGTATRKRPCSITCNTNCSAPCHPNWPKPGACWRICRASTRGCASTCSALATVISTCTICRPSARLSNPGKTPSGCRSFHPSPICCVTSPGQPSVHGIAAPANGSPPNRTGRPRLNTPCSPKNMKWR